MTPSERSNKETAVETAEAENSGVVGSTRRPGVTVLICSVVVLLDVVVSKVIPSPVK